MSATGRQMNWTAVSFGTSPSPTAINGVTEVRVDPGGALKTFAGDTDKFPTTIVSDRQNPKVTITTANVAVAQGFASGTIGTDSATFEDAKLATGGAIVYMISNAVVENSEGGGAHQEFGEATLSLLCYSSDGTTSPIAFTRS
jgi:hypothetical protein